MKGAIVRILSICIVFSLILLGCANPDTKLLNDKTYPLNWPSINVAANSQHFLDGTYSNLGILIDDNTQESCFLSELFLGNKDIKNNQISLQVNSPPRRLSKIVLIWEGEVPGRQELPYSCVWSGSVLVCGVNQSGTSLAPAGMIMSGKTFYLAKGVDGSLIIKIEHQDAGIIVFVPFYSGKSYWGRFLPYEN